MKITTNPGSIIAACTAAIADIDQRRAEIDAATLAPYKTGTTGFWFWRQTFQRSHDEQVAALWYDNRMRLGFPPIIPMRIDYPCTLGWDQRQRCEQLRAIAKHKRDAFTIELDEPWLTDIAIYLDPFQGGRI